MSNIEGKTKTLVAQLLAHPDPKLRAAAFAKKVGNLSLEELVSILNRICTRATLKDPIYLQAYHCLPDLLLPWFSDRNKNLALRKVARRKDYPEVLQLLIDFPARKTQGLEFAGEDLQVKELTLGERKSLAKAHHPACWRRLLKERDPAVIRLLLANPRLTETDALKIASLRPTSPAILKEIHLHPKWTARYRVKKALVCNPFCPPGIGVHLLKSMLNADLQEISGLEDLHLAVREVAHSLLRK